MWKIYSDFKREKKEMIKWILKSNQWFESLNEIYRFGLALLIIIGSMVLAKYVINPTGEPYWYLFVWIGLIFWRMIYFGIMNLRKRRGNE